MEVQAYKQSDAGNLSTWAADINAAHADAVRHAASAIDYAKAAGALLLKVKQKLPHGAFGDWLEANCMVKARQAQNYMSAAQGKPVPVRDLANTQRAAYLDLPASPAQESNLTIVASPVVEPETEAPPDYSELDAAHDLVNALQSELVVARMGDIPEEEKQQATDRLAEQDAQIKTLEATLKAVTLSRDTLMEERVQMMRQMAMQRREIDALKKAAHPAGTH